ncbi:MAG: hypothetical protein ACLQVK_13025 [Acidimicrobiales bacterium]
MVTELTPEGRRRRLPLVPLRYATVVAGLALAVLAYGYALNQNWATQTWPWPDTDLSHLFVGSIAAAVAAIAIWIGATGEWGALRSAAIDVIVISGGLSVYFFVRLAEGKGLLGYALFFTAAALAGVAGWYWSRRVPIRDTRRMPVGLRAWFVLFAAITAATGTALLLRIQVFPWALDPRTAVMFGCVFLGAAAYFLYGLADPSWHNAKAQLVGFLAYDVVLFPRYVSLMSSTTGPYGYPASVNSVHLDSYLAVLSLSSLVSIYYLFVSPRTRNWSVQERPDGAVPVLTEGQGAFDTV